MAWNTIKRRQYYYHSVATPTGVKTTYYGNGKRAHEAAARHAAERVANREQQEVQRRYITTTGNTLAPINTAFKWLELFIRADALLAQCPSYTTDPQWENHT